MSPWKVALIAVALGLLLWFLSPQRALPPNDPAVVEIGYSGEAGVNNAVMDDAFRAFEAESRQLHEKNPRHPIYRVINGQSASRDQTADPTRFLVSVAGGQPPDLILFDRYAVSEWAARGAFTKLDPYLAREATSNDPEAIRPENYYKSCWEEVAYTDPITGERGIYGIPERVDDRALFYNKDLLKRAGYVDEKGEARPPRTEEELAEMAVKLTEHNSKGAITRLGFAPNYGNAWLYLYAWMNGGEFMSADRRRVTMNSPAVVEALDWMTRIYDSLGGAAAVYAFQSSAQVGQLDPFLSGRVAIKIDGYWTFPEGLAQYGDNLNYGVTVPPVPASRQGQTPASWVSGWCFAIPATARHKEGGWELLKFMSSLRAIKILGEANHLQLGSQGLVFVPTQNANRRINQWLYDTYIASNPAIPDKEREGVKLLNDLLDHSPIRPVTPVGQLLFNEQKRATENAIFHKSSPKAALDEANQTVQRQLDRALRPPRGSLVPWRYFIWTYLTLIIIIAVFIYWRETKPSTARGHLPKAGLGDHSLAPQRTDNRLRAPVIAARRALPRAIYETTAGRLEGTRSRYFRSQWRGGWLCASPWIIGFILFTGGPILFSIIISLCDYDILNPARFVGFANYRWMFTGDHLFWKSVGNTAYMIIGIPLGMALSLGIALLLNLEIRGVAVWRTFFYLPSIVPAVAASILWIWIFNPNAGLLNAFLASFGIHGPNWLQDENTSKPALILMGLWSAGGGMIIWLAGLKGISASYYEAAAIDGANAWQRFRHITLPLLSPYIFFTLIMGLIGTLQIFTQAFIMTQGGPVDSTLFYAYHLFNSAFRFLQMGYASALGWFLFLVVFALTMLQLRLSKHWVHYEA
jgi:ABC-type sugar transport system permease subunit/ABC-type glycerol-3-phosphate transport system substrate-binding protein